MARRPCKRCPWTSAEHLVIKNRAKLNYYRKLSVVASVLNLAVSAVLRGGITLDHLLLNVSSYIMHVSALSLMYYVSKPCYGETGVIIYPGWDLGKGGPGDVFKDIINVTALVQFLAAYHIYMWWLMALVAFRVCWYGIEYLQAINYLEEKKATVLRDDETIRYLKYKLMELRRIKTLKALEQRFNRMERDPYWDQCVDDLQQFWQKELDQVEVIREVIIPGDKDVININGPNGTKHLQKVEFDNEASSSSLRVCISDSDLSTITEPEKIALSSFCSSFVLDVRRKSHPQPDESAVPHIRVFFKLSKDYVPIQQQILQILPPVHHDALLGQLPPFSQFPSPLEHLLLQSLNENQRDKANK